MLTGAARPRAEEAAISKAAGRKASERAEKLLNGEFESQTADAWAASAARARAAQGGLQRTILEILFFLGISVVLQDPSFLAVAQQNAEPRATKVGCGAPRASQGKVCVPSNWA